MVTTIDQVISVGEGVHAVLVEDEGVTVVCDREIAEGRGWAYEGEFDWLTLDVHSSLDAVGLTAAVAGALSDADIPCNVLAGYFHDHLLVPIARADDAARCLSGLASH